MNVVVKILPVCRHQLLALLSARTTQLEDAINLAEVYLEGARDLLVANAGPPANASS